MKSSWGVWKSTWRNSRSISHNFLCSPRTEIEKSTFYTWMFRRKCILTSLTYKYSIYSPSFWETYILGELIALIIVCWPDLSKWIYTLLKEWIMVAIPSRLYKNQGKPKWIILEHSITNKDSISVISGYIILAVILWFFSILKKC